MGVRQSTHSPALYQKTSNTEVTSQTKTAKLKAA
jgi:hypothetical protein